MRSIKHFAMFLLLMIPTLATSAGANTVVSELAVQPLAPGVFAVTWTAVEPARAAELHRRIADGTFDKVGDLNTSQLQVVDRAEMAAGVRVTYRLIELDDNGKTTVPHEDWADNSAELVTDGNFEVPVGTVPHLSGLAISASAPWSAEIVEGGRSGGTRCIQFSTSDPNAAASFSISTRWYIVSPRTIYHFSWWTTQSEHGTSIADGQGYAMTKERVKSYFDRTPALYVQLATRDGAWLGSSAEPKLQPDIRYVYGVLRGQGHKHAEPIRVDDISIVDRDIELLLATNLDKLLDDVRASVQRHPGLKLGEKAEALIHKVDSHRRALYAEENQDIDKCLSHRADLCQALRELNRMSVILRLKELK